MAVAIVLGLFLCLSLCVCLLVTVIAKCRRRLSRRERRRHGKRKAPSFNLPNWRLTFFPARKANTRSLSVAAAAVSGEAQLRTPERGLPPFEPEDPSSRICQCTFCEKVPAAQSFCKRVEEEPPTYAGIYPRGLQSLALAELQREGVEIVSSLEEHCVFLFRIPRGRIVELSCFEHVFEAIGRGMPMPPKSSVADIAKAADEGMRESTDLWRRRLRRFKKWRATVHRDQMKASYKAPEVVPVIGDYLAALGACSLSLHCKAGPVVDLADYEVEVIVYLSDGIDKLVAAADTKARAAIVPGPEMMLLGILDKDAPCRLVELSVEKGSNVLSRAHDTVALAVAHRAADILAARAMAPDSRAITIMDPMCGVGTYLLAMCRVLAHRKDVTHEGINMLAADIDAESSSMLLRNACRSEHVFPLSVMQSDSMALPVRDASVDIIVVDPPWGQRHCSAYYVKKHFPKWMREWIRVLKPGGAVVIVTICKRIFEEIVLPPLQQEGLLELEENTQFDNKGWCVCRLYVARKPLQAQ